MRVAVLSLLLTAVTGAGLAHAQTTPRETSPTPNPSPGKFSTNSPRGKTPISGEVSIADRAPDFVLDGSTGLPVKLSTLRGKWVMLVFADRYRDVAHLDSLVGSAAQIKARVVAVCHEKAQTLISVTAKDKVHMLMLADPTGEVTAVYGQFDWMKGVTDPAFFVIDPEGIVRLAVLGKIFPAEEMFSLLSYATGDWERSSDKSE